MDLDCSHAVFFNQDYKDEWCTVAKNDDCADNVAFINFYAFTYCQLDGMWYLFIPIAIIFIILMFK